MMKARRNIQGNMKSEPIVDDILTTVMVEMDGNGISTLFVTKDLSLLPKCDPKYIDLYANHQLIINLQE